MNIDLGCDGGQLTMAQSMKTDDQVLDEINVDTLDILGLADFDCVFDSLVDSQANEFVNLLTTFVVQQVVQQER